ncbi:MAG TPA: adenylate/guanylate cyclase domain-containing protein, partial [Candidatus Angelobacter sp.]|nr:adenylate/guanylate cyclase domain-containing protein [Candidatus Angelobacter sp.]
MPQQDFDLAAWLRDLKLERYAQAFRDAEVTPEVLPELTDADLRELGLPLGPRRALLKAIRGLASVPAPSAAARGARAGAGPSVAMPSEAERRQLTVMFVDLVGSTVLASTLDPEDTDRVLRTYRTRCADIVRRWGGHVAKYLGDGVLAYFGYPEAHEDDAERAARAGLDLAEAVGRMEAGEGGARLSARVGIATGLVVVGELIGEGAAREEVVAGETPNLAARLQALAEPGTVVVAERTRRLLGNLFDLVDLGPHLSPARRGRIGWRGRLMLCECRIPCRRSWRRASTGCRRR